MTNETVPTLTLTPADVQDLAGALKPYHAISGAFFARSESRTWAERSLQGLLSPLPRKSIGPIVIAQLGASGHAVRGMQQFVTDSTMMPPFCAAIYDLGDPGALFPGARANPAENKGPAPEPGAGVPAPACAAASATTNARPRAGAPGLLRSPPRSGRTRAPATHRTLDRQ